MKSAMDLARDILRYAASSDVEMVYAIRADNAAKHPGSICRRSMDLSDHEGAQRHLNGTCGTHIDVWMGIDATTGIDEIAEAIEVALSINRGYIGKHRYIIAGEADISREGDDSAEIVCATRKTLFSTAGAVVVAVVE